MTDDGPSGPLDVATLDALASRAASHSLVDDTAFRPDGVAPRRLELRLDAEQYPASVDDARLDVRWYVGGDYTIHYREVRGGEDWQCRWDRHPKPDEPQSHFHPPPNADAGVETSGIESTHHLDVLFSVLEWIASRVADLHDGSADGQ